MDIPWTKEQLYKANIKLRNKCESLRTDKEDMYHIATRADWHKSDWEDFKRICEKNK
ncbi:hypothetical protein ACTHP3_05015 [Shouchella rhizosphaerae]|uniref:hypothetical protein n=1 Tax=Shouchella rhizosphaerae TaxID=866786 RepID=UPI003F80BB46